VRRLLFCLPLLLIFIPDSSSREPVSPTNFRPVADNGAPLPSQGEMERLARRDPIAFLAACINRYDREVKGFTTNLRKQERIDGTLERGELIDVAFREDPFSVLMKWKDGARRAQGSLFIKGENKGQILVRPSGLFAVVGVVKRDPNGPDAKKAGRYPLTEFGIKIGMERTLTSWEKAQKDNALHIEYLGEKRIKEAGDRTCWVLEQTHYRKPEEDGITQLTIYVDKETWLQVGSILKGSEGQLIGEYFFRDIQLNPHFKPDAFTPEALMH
jgi:hypothetical protein